ALNTAALQPSVLSSHPTTAISQSVPLCQYQPGLTNYASLTPWMQAVPIDEGFIDYAAFFSALCDGGYSGPVAYEMCSPVRGGNSMDVLGSFARRVFEVIGFMWGQPRGAG